MSGERSEPIAPVGADLDRPSVARVYDYYLGGTTNWAVDRAFGDQVLQRFPLLKKIAQSNRMFLNRVVRHLVGRGVRQFLDIGAGVPTAGNTHQVADDLARSLGRTPDAKVVYVDNELVAVAHAEVLLDRFGDPRRHAVIEADLRDPVGVWHEALDMDVFDLDEPIALLLIAVLHVAQPNERGIDIAAESVAKFRELLPTGSYLAISHITDEGVPAELGASLRELKQMYDTSSSSNVIWRSRADIGAMLEGFALIEPGLTWTPNWHPEDAAPDAPTLDFVSPSHAVIWAGVGQKV